MDKARIVFGQMAILLELAPSLKPFVDPNGSEAKVLRRQLLRFLNDFIGDLGIPAEISLMIRACDKKAKLADSAYRLFMNGRQCRVRHSAVAVEGKPAEEVATTVAGSIYRNRHLALSVTLSEKLQEQWAAECCDGNTAGQLGAGFHDVLAELLRLGCRMDRWKQVISGDQMGYDAAIATMAHELYLRRGGGSGHDVEDWLEAERLHRWKRFEDVVSEAAAIKVWRAQHPDRRKVTSSKGLQAFAEPDRKYLESALAVVSDYIFEDLGIILPTISIESDEVLLADQCRIQLNDLRFPPITIERHTTSPRPEDVIAAQLRTEVEDNGGALLSTEAVQCSLFLLKQSFPTLVEATFSRFDIAQLTGVLRKLLEGKRSIKNLRNILEALLAINGTIAADRSKRMLLSPHVTSLCPVSQGNPPREYLRVEELADYVRTSLGESILPIRAN
jgi:hypothetical protein